MFSFDGSLLGRSILVPCDVVDVQEGFQFLKEQVQEGLVAIVPCEARDGLGTEHTRQHSSADIRMTKRLQDFEHRAVARKARLGKYVPSSIDVCRRDWTLEVNNHVMPRQAMSGSEETAQHFLRTSAKLNAHEAPVDPVTDVASNS